ncbi:hypothetical protein CCR94_18795 [Rhodoblastus sphagnicola]|uniref:Uncharacterized protein n=1 Tax=Rhodoblastus sphagnicola TaxID=333368 RepID=A0A2S6N0I1_9HYPH|nr:hypothetical protein [Rhodoblastus sphagnicola]MBB4198583.1 hypothetical protein [Rhodoblastus sphagnicola]PPQ28096.1 hypothetical protein CCR94_18795 [Rhodoblastus sphagnicola]
MAPAPREKLKKTIGARSRTKQEAQAEEQPLDRVNRDLAILNMRLHGLTFHEIARKLPEAGFARVSVSRIYAIVGKALRSSPNQPARDLRQLELMRLDQLQTAHYKEAMKGDSAAAQRVLAIMDRRAKLLGLDANTEAGASLDEARQSLINKLEQLARGQQQKSEKSNTNS